MSRAPFRKPVRVAGATMLVLALCAAPAGAALTTTVQELADPQPQAGAEFGLAVAGLGDLDGDGVADVAVGAPKRTANHAGEVVVYSGASSSVLRRIKDPAGAGYHFGYSVAPAGDVDGDGVTDLVIGAPGVDGFVPLPCPVDDCAPTPESGRAFLYSGMTGALLRQLVPTDLDFVAFGRSVASLGDITGDGVPDVAVGAPLLIESGWFTNKRGMVYAFSGATGAQLWKVLEPQQQPIPSFGWSLASLPDVSGDGRPDLLVGAPFAGSGAGQAHVLSGATGTLVRTLQSPLGPGSDALFGYAVTGAGDTSGDGQADLAVGQLRPGGVHLFTAGSGTHLRSIASPLAGSETFFGAALAAAGDVDGDGRHDLFVGAPGSGAVHAIPGDSAAAVTTVHDPDPSDGEPGLRGFGSSVAAAVTLGGDPGADVVVGDRIADVAGKASAGRAYTVVLRLNRPPVADAGPDVTVECAAQGGATVQLDGSGSTDPDADPLTYTWTAPDGTTVGTAVAVQIAAPLGTTTYTLTVDDGVSGSSSDTVLVTVVDTTPPTASAELSPDVLWPPDHKMRPVQALVGTGDVCDPDPTVTLVDVVSSEPDAGPGHDHAGDIQQTSPGTDDRAFLLRAERIAPTLSRVYTATYAVTDASGNSTTTQATSTVPRDWRAQGSP